VDDDGRECVDGTDEEGRPCFSTTVTGQAPLSPWLVGTLAGLSYVVQPVVQTTKAIQYVAHAVNPMQFQYPSCVLGQMGTWGMAGGVGGAAAGGVGVLAGGVGEFATVPAGALTGSISGALAGGAVGAIKCAGNSESGGGGGGDRGGSRTIQTGGNTISKQAAKALNQFFGKNLTTREWGRALEAMKDDEGLGNNFHGQIKDNGDVFENGKFVGNLAQYLP